MKKNSKRIFLKNNIKFFVFLICFFSFFSSSDAFSKDDYLLGSGDVLKVNVYDHPDLMTTARIDNEGAILFPLAGRIFIGGLTISEASSKIRDELDGDYIVNPQVSIFVEEFRSRKIVVIGEVVRPGLYELSGPTSLLELISKAGGLTKQAGQTVSIRRAGNGLDAEDYNIVVDLQELLESNPETTDVSLKDGDTVSIEKAGAIYVTGQVNRPSMYAYEPETTVIKAITLAGGFTQLAAQSKVKIIRKINGNEQVLERVPLGELLQPDDVVVVPESFF